MPESSPKTRFAPSPTGFVHLGNARTALFSALLARGGGGTFLLRIEDTDRERSRDEFVAAVEEDLVWLGIPWQEGPECDGGNGPYRQSERIVTYESLYRQLEEQQQAYPCFCTTRELELSRKAQRSAGKPPRYSGKCAHLSPEERQVRLDAGEKPTLRFRVPTDRTVTFTDLVRGEQRFPGAEIGDFIIRRADGSPAFFFSNAVDDALMGVTHVLRGEDHLTNTPRQLMLLQALGLETPAYGHITLIVGPDGSPLSKRHGSRSVRELRSTGYLPLAVTNYLARLGHKYDSDDFMSVAELAENFDLKRLGRAPARFDAHQLLHWQHRALELASTEEIWEWMGEGVSAVVADEHRNAFIEAVRPNISFPEHAEKWAHRLFTDPLELGDEAREVVAEAGSDFFRAALEGLEEHPDDFKGLANAVKKATGSKGKSLFMPLRAALTGETGGPEMGRVFPLIGVERARQRLAACIE